jgi:transposase InsO family protein
VVEEMPFAIQHIQTDRGGELFAEKVQHWLAEHMIKFRPMPPRSPDLNGKLERSQLTDLQEFRVRPGHESTICREFAMGRSLCALQFP